MKWKGRRQSSNIEDARGQRASSGAAGAGTVLNLVGRTFGFKGILILLVVGFVGWQMGLVDPVSLLGGGQVQQTEYRATPEEQERFNFVTVVLADTEDIWSAEFKRVGKQYREPTLVIFSGRTNTRCGVGDARMGPFYCPADQKVYIDLSFYDELAREFKAPGDFAQAYVIAHEVGHHVQNLLGVSDQVHRQRARMSKTAGNALTVRLELQADCFAGVWGHHAASARNLLERGDVEEGLAAAAAIGDDRLQRRAGGAVRPESWTHGSSQQRTEWFRRGLEYGRVDLCDTFGDDRP